MFLYYEEYKYKVYNDYTKALTEKAWFSLTFDFNVQIRKKKSMFWHTKVFCFHVASTQEENTFEFTAQPFGGIT